MKTYPLPEELIHRIEAEAQRLGVTPEERVIAILDEAVAAAEDLSVDLWTYGAGLPRLKVYLLRLPAVSHVTASSPGEPDWWLKFQIDIEHPLAWHVVQALGFVLNYISLTERLPTRLMPVSPPPYLNGGPRQFLSWVIEPTAAFVDAARIAEILEARLPQPAEEVGQWDFDAEEPDEVAP